MEKPWQLQGCVFKGESGYSLSTINFLFSYETGNIRAVWLKIKPIRVARKDTRTSRDAEPAGCEVMQILRWQQER